MPMDLIGAGGDFSFTIFGWGAALDLAYRYGGWEPAGTNFNADMVRAECEMHDCSPEEIEAAIAENRAAWDGTYFTNDYQVVTAEDAANLAAALERALADVPDHNAMTHKEKIVVCNGETLRGIPADTRVSPVEFWSGHQGKDYLRRFIRFCRAGEFRIC